jgi:antitoxin (DNA-binding transcriptional repressor) of toxin-antitoxin stability system
LRANRPVARLVAVAGRAAADASINAATAYWMSAVSRALQSFWLERGRAAVPARGRASRRE